MWTAVYKFVEMQGFEPWSRQGNRRAFYMLRLIRIVGSLQV